jgi:hypothetical protein
VDGFTLRLHAFVLMPNHYPPSHRTGPSQPQPRFKDYHSHLGRDQILYLSRRATGLPVSQLANEVGLKQGANVCMAVKRYQARISTDPAEKALTARAAQMLRYDPNEFITYLLSHVRRTDKTPQVKSCGAMRKFEFRSCYFL